MLPAATLVERDARVGCRTFLPSGKRPGWPTSASRPARSMALARPRSYNRRRMGKEPTILISAAERSGDMHAANLIREVVERRPEVRFEGFAGTLARDAGCVVHEDLVSLASMGLGFRKHIFRYSRAIRRFQALIDEKRPEAVVLIDSPGMNFALARIARWKGLPVVYYICPQIWAWAPWRRSKILKYTDLLLVILPFEEALYQNPRVPVRHVGHPLADDLAKVPVDAGERLRARLGIPADRSVVGVLPGSREHEVRELAPILAGTISRMADGRRDLHVIVSCFREEYRRPLADAFASCPFPCEIIAGDSREIVLAADLVLVASGTASLEVAFFERPMVVVYRAGTLGRFIYNLMAVTPFFTLPNILGAQLFEGEPVVHERLCRGDEADDLARIAGRLLDPGAPRDEALARLRRLKAEVFRPGASARAAEALLEFLGSRAPA